MTPAAGLPAATMHVFERGWLSSNNILFIGRDETAIVDTGYASHAPQTLALVEAALGGRPLDRLLNTHLHSDHCGGNAELQRRYPGLRTAIPPGEAEAVRDWNEEALSHAALSQQCPRFVFDALLRPSGEVLLGDMAWQVHAAKGHDPHSVILFEPISRTLLSADALWQKGFGIVFPELAGEPSFDEVAATLDLIESLRPARVVPGHGAPFEDVADALVAARSRLDAFAREPLRHARHALKALLKFKLLEIQEIARPDWESMLTRTPYLESIKARFFADQDARELGEELLGELVRSGLAGVEGNLIRNK